MEKSIHAYLQSVSGLVDMLEILSEKMLQGVRNPSSSKVHPLFRRKMSRLCASLADPSYESRGCYPCCLPNQAVEGQRTSSRPKYSTHSCNTNQEYLTTAQNYVSLTALSNPPVLARYEAGHVAEVEHTIRSLRFIPGHRILMLRYMVLLLCSIISYD